MSTIKTGLSSSARYVYHGPNSSTYKKLGSVDSGETVKALWKEGSWLHIEYNVSGTSKKKRGCIPASSVNLSESVSTITNLNATRYVHRSSKAYNGPSSSAYTEADFGLPKGLEVKYVGQKIDNYAYVEFTDPSTSSGTTPKKMRAYFYASNLGSAFMMPTFYDYEGIWRNSKEWNDTDGTYKGHIGNDYVKSGTKIKALSDGIVYSKSSSKLTYNGYTITLLHAIKDKMYFTFHAHMDTQPSMTVGTILEAGQDIHPYGSSGASSTGPHLHLGVYFGVQTDNLAGYNRVSGQKATFNDGNTGVWVYNSRKYFDSRKVFTTNGNVILNN